MRTLTTASRAVVVTHRSASTGPVIRKSLVIGLVVYTAPVGSLSRSSFVHGSGSRMPAVHWLDFRVHTPGAGVCAKQAPASAPLRAAGPGAPAPPRDLGRRAR